MQTVKLTKDIEHSGLREGDLLAVDEFSAKALIARGDATEYKPQDATAELEAEGETASYGGQEAATIDDIVDPAARRHKAVMTVSQVAAADPGPQAKPKAEPKAEHTSKSAVKSAARGASGANPAGGDADGGSGPS